MVGAVGCCGVLLVSTSNGSHVSIAFVRVGRAETVQSRAADCSLIVCDRKSACMASESVNKLCVCVCVCTVAQQSHQALAAELLYASA